MSVKRNEGFTLVELLVTIVVASVVTMAATTVLLLGIRLNKNSTTTVQQQNTVRVFLSVMEQMASEGTIAEVTSGPDSWEVKDKDNKLLFSYNATEATISASGTPMMEDVIASHIVLSDSLLTVGVETVDGGYTTSVYCRGIATLKDELENDPVTTPDTNLTDDSMGEVEKAARAKFLNILLSQRGSTGMILEDIAGNGTMMKTPVYYSEWYSNFGWPITTPWCGCFISWGLDQVKDQVKEETKQFDDLQFLQFASVETCKRYFEAINDHYTEGPAGWKDYDYTPAPGDLIIFDWTREREQTDHIGAVLAVIDGYVYTIEGNTANMVAVRKYALNDTVIMGYCVIDWKEDPATEPQTE